MRRSAVIAAVVVLAAGALAVLWVRSGGSQPGSDRADRTSASPAAGGKGERSSRCRSCDRRESDRLDRRSVLAVAARRSRGGAFLHGGRRCGWWPSATVPLYAIRVRRVDCGFARSTLHQFDRAVRSALRARDDARPQLVGQTLALRSRWHCGALDVDILCIPGSWRPERPPGKQAAWIDAILQRQP
jgi:hypothetical protein